ncbi:hypothetical protein EVAR_103304_1 [Eumeta japonica]|uniref:Uncharacterized protein n=1 Tax=Eumeta variegata TaxID=151549 RepID=A0A4C1XR17_EUMVA|nr:hypothetical protein EVAR_103304_1 [Eumeta japonica]
MHYTDCKHMPAARRDKTSAAGAIRRAANLADSRPAYRGESHTNVSAPARAPPRARQKIINIATNAQADAVDARWRVTARANCAAVRSLCPVTLLSINNFKNDSHIKQKSFTLHPLRSYRSGYTVRAANVTRDSYCHCTRMSVARLASTARTMKVPAMTQLLTYSSDFGAARLYPCELQSYHIHTLSERSACAFKIVTFLPPGKAEQESLKAPPSLCIPHTPTTYRARRPASNSRFSQTTPRFITSRNRTTLLPSAASEPLMLDQWFRLWRIDVNPDSQQLYSSSIAG